MAQIVSLEYDRDAHRRRWQRRVRRWWPAVALPVVIAVGWMYRQPISSRAREMYWARQCAKFTVPADTPRVVSDPKEMARLAADPNYAPHTIYGAKSWTAARSLQPRCWRELAPLTGVDTYHFSGENTVFLHE